MKKTLTAAAVLALGLIAHALMPASARADGYVGSWQAVCCGAMCDGGDYCRGNGNYVCCKP